VHTEVNGQNRRKRKQEALEEDGTTNVPDETKSGETVTTTSYIVAMMLLTMMMMTMTTTKVMMDPNLVQTRRKSFPLSPSVCGRKTTVLLKKPSYHFATWSTRKSSTLKKIGKLHYSVAGHPAIVKAIRRHEKLSRSSACWLFLARSSCPW
jgi:hypothetical protein